MRFQGLLRILKGQTREEQDFEETFIINSEERINFYKKEAMKKLSLISYEQISGLSQQQNIRNHFLKAVQKEIVDEGLLGNHNPIIDAYYEKISRERGEMQYA